VGFYEEAEGNQKKKAGLFDRSEGADSSSLYPGGKGNGSTDLRGKRNDSAKAARGPFRNRGVLKKEEGTRRSGGWRLSQNKGNPVDMSKG